MRYFVANHPDVFYSTRPKQVGAKPFSTIRKVGLLLALCGCSSIGTLRQSACCAATARAGAASSHRGEIRHERSGYHRAGRSAGRGKWHRGHPAEVTGKNIAFHKHVQPGKQGPETAAIGAGGRGLMPVVAVVAPRRGAHGHRFRNPAKIYTGRKRVRSRLARQRGIGRSIGRKSCGTRPIAVSGSDVQALKFLSEQLHTDCAPAAIRIRLRIIAQRVQV